MKKCLFLIVLILFLTSGCNKEYYCDNGDTLKGTTCITKKTTPAQIEYYCTMKQAYLIGNRCLIYYGSYANYSVDAQARYYCTDGYLSGSSCIIESTYNAYER